jgi:hypothetical protein
MKRRAALEGLRRVTPRRLGETGISSSEAASDHTGVFQYGTVDAANSVGPDIMLAQAWGQHGRSAFNWAWYNWPFGYGADRMVCVGQLFPKGGTIRKLTTYMFRSGAVNNVALSIYSNLGPSKLWPKTLRWQTTFAPETNPITVANQTFDVNLSVAGGSLMWLGFSFAGGSGTLLYPRLNWWDPGYPGLLGGNRSDLVLASADPGSENWSPTAWIVTATFPGPATIGQTSPGVRVPMMQQPIAGFTFERS